jgi:SAM-dependent methyltransferase
MASDETFSADYGNWVSSRLILIPTIIGIILLVASIPWWYLAIISVALFAVALYFAYARNLFAPDGGNVQTMIWDLALSNLQWNGQGKAIDIGCGNGALTIRAAKKYPQAQIIGVDYWGQRWDYSKETCQENAKAEGVETRTIFEKASASKLPFSDGYFDAAFSNLCFHEVADAKDKREVIREALRVVKKGGKFAFQDQFLQKNLYGTPEELVAAIKSWGVSEVEFVETHNAPFIPSVLRLPFIVGKISIIRGQK